VLTMGSTIGEGEIIVTRRLYELLKTQKAYRFIQSSTIEIKARAIETFRIEYENPRTIADDYLVQTIFIADEKSDNIRDKSIGLLITNFLIAKGGSSELSDLLPYLKEKESVDIDINKLLQIIEKNGLFRKIDDRIEIDKEKQSIILKVKEDFTKSKNECILFVAEEIAKTIGLTSEYLLESVNIGQLIEKYLVSVFNEIKMVSFYYNEENTLYNRLSEISDFDAILKMDFEIIRKLSKEEFLIFKETFLKSLSKVSIKNNQYIASIFHNILSNYYLNRNEKYLSGQLSRLRRKKYYIIMGPSVKTIF
jgi:hypothetical protein